MAKSLLRRISRQNPGLLYSTDLPAQTGRWNSGFFAQWQLALANRSHPTL
jgi:hypothetical protein